MSAAEYPEVCRDRTTRAVAIADLVAAGRPVPDAEVDAYLEAVVAEERALKAWRAELHSARAPSSQAGVATFLQQSTHKP